MCDVTCTTVGGNRQPRWQPTTAGDAVVTVTVTALTGTDYCKCRSQCVLVKPFLFIYLLLRFAYSGVLLMTVFLKIYPIPKIRNIPIYRLAYSIAMYRNISYRNPCIVMRIVSPDSCQYTALVIYWANYKLKQLISIYSHNNKNCLITACILALCTFWL